MALARDDQVGPLQTGGQADEAGDEVEAGLDAGPQGDQTARQPTGGTPARARR